MKKRTILKLSMTLALMVFLSNSLKAQKTFGSAVEYMNYIGEQYDQLTDDQWSYTSAVANDKKAKKIEAKRTALLQTNKTAQTKIAKLPGFAGNTEYRDSVVSFLKLNYNVLNDDYDKIVNMEEVAEQSYDAMEAYLLTQELATQKINNASKMLTAVQTKFATDNDITLLENQSKKSKKLEKASLMYKYYNQVYLIFFKSYIQEVNFIDALGTGDVSAMEQSKSALLEYSEEGLKKLQALKPFNGDNSLKLAGTEILKFYKQESSKESLVMIDFFLKKEQFESIKKAFEAKKKKDQTQEDFDQFNGAVNDYNNASNSYNSTNEYLNKTRSKQLNNWNNSATKFTKKHV